VILFVFAYDAAIRVLGYRWAVVNGNRLLDMIDIFIILLSIIVYIWMLSFNSAGITKLVTFARIIRLLRLLKLVRIYLLYWYKSTNTDYAECLRQAKHLRKMVGSNRRRFRKDGFDLDLTYITPSGLNKTKPRPLTKLNQIQKGRLRPGPRLHDALRSAYY